MTLDYLLPKAIRQAALDRAIRSTIRDGQTLSTTCLSCGQVISATIGGVLPVGAILSAGPCISVPGSPRYRHAPGVFYRGERIR